MTDDTVRRVVSIDVADASWVFDRGRRIRTIYYSGSCPVSTVDRAGRLVDTTGAELTFDG
jgi:hypothetical protein